jgi:hypothetical protein
MHRAQLGEMPLARPGLIVIEAYRRSIQRDRHGADDGYWTFTVPFMPPWMVQV